jgi:CHAT domain-containing protein/tetratricopeptide (TPR) repeat protein
MKGPSHRLHRRPTAEFRLAVLALVGVISCHSPGNPGARPEQAQRALASGNYVEAERAATAWLADVERREGAESLATARALDLLVESSSKNGNAGASHAPARAERAVRLKVRHLGDSHLDTAISLHNLGIVYLHRGEVSAAMQTLERSLSIRTAALDRDSPTVADSLDVLGLSLIRLERFQAADEKLNESRRVRELSFDRNPLALARTLELVALRHRYTDNYAAALPLIDRALEIRSRVSPDHPDALLALQTRGDVMLLMGDAAGAQRSWASALTLVTRALRPGHPANAEILGRLAISASSLGSLGEARQLAERGLAIIAPSSAPCDHARSLVEVALANILEYDGEYAEARKLYRGALDRVRACGDAGASSARADNEATLVFNEAQVARHVGDLAEADDLYQTAVDIWSKGLGPNHSFVARGLDALADVAAARGQLKRAHATYERALQIKRRSLGTDHPHVAWTLTNLARTEADMGNMALALRHLEEAIAIFKKSGASDEPDQVARVLELRGILEARRARYRPARNSLEDALEERARIFGAGHPLVAQTRVTLAAVDFALGNTDQALAAALDAERFGREHLLFTVRYLPERQAMTYAERRPQGLDLALTITAAKSVGDLTPVLDAVIRSRGIVLDEFAARPRAGSASDPDIKGLVERVTSSRQRFANLVVRSLQEPVSRSVLDEARREKEEAERALAERSVETRAELTRLSAGSAAVRRALPEGSVLVSFVRYSRTRLPTTKQTSPLESESVYGAFVTYSGDRATAFVDLGSGARLDAAVTAWRREVSGTSILESRSPLDVERQYHDSSIHLRRIVWDPLAPHIARARRAFVVPDGLINLVNLAALPDGDGYVLERQPVLHYLTTERDLLIPEREDGASSALLAVGGPAFDERLPAAAAQSALRGSECQSLAEVRFAGLPGSLNEVSDISALWVRSKSTDVTLLSGPAATESAVKRAVAGHRVVHLATHGFFLGSDCTPAAAGLRAVGGIARSSSVASVAAENPLLLTGLALAGANNRGGVALDQDEGLLTADEIAGLDLQGTEWAVLSACDTGLGEIKAGEGVFGLRRAFQIAGARTVIMSLWSVEDQSAREWMRALYEGRLRRNLDTAAAVREAGLSVLRARRARGQSTHPFYWAAFVAAGDWR